MADDFMKCRFCKKWFYKLPNTTSRRDGQKYIHTTICPMCGNELRVEHNRSRAPSPTNYRPNREVEIIE